MKGRKKEVFTLNSIFGNKNRVDIWTFCKAEPRSFTDLKKIIKISSGTLFHHINILEETNLITKEEIKDKGKYKKGKEIKIFVSNQNMNKYNQLYKEEEERAIFDYSKKTNKHLSDETTFQVLEKLNVSDLSLKELTKGIKTKNVSDIYIIINWLRFENYIKEKYTITSKGDKLLKEKKKK
jgi:predicted transcriptional regulator